MILFILAIIVGFALLIWSADRFVDGAAVSAQYAGMPSLLIGMKLDILEIENSPARPDYAGMKWMSPSGLFWKWAQSMVLSGNRHGIYIFC